MKRRHLKQILFLSILIAGVLGGISYAINANNQTGDVAELNLIDEETQSVQLSIDGLYEDAQISIDGNETVLRTLEKLNNTNQELQLTTEDFGEMGILVEAMGGQVNGTDNKYWQYTINGVSPMLGADAYVLENGDSVRWEFKSSEF